MRRLVLAATLCLIVPSLSHATTYYIAASGSDSNNGTSKSTPWLHAPGMAQCTSNCAAANPQPGDKFIFRGGDGWYFGNTGATVYIGSSWNWTWSGGSTCNLDISQGALNRTPCIYIGGGDQTWYSGSGYARPIISMSNPLSTGPVANCVYNDDFFNGPAILAAYTIWDNWDAQGTCVQTSPSNGAAAFFGVAGSNGGPVEYSNNYLHGWTYTSFAMTNPPPPAGTGAGAGYYTIFGCNGHGCSTFSLIDHNVFDGSDSTGASTAYTSTQKAMGTCTDLEFNVIRYVSNGCVDGSGTKTIHDNLFEFMYNPENGHGNLVEMGDGVTMPPNPSPNGNVYMYRNVVRHTDNGEMFDFQPGLGSTVYATDNVYYDNANGGNCMMVEKSSGAAYTLVFVNNSVDAQTNVQGNTNGGCSLRLFGATNLTMKSNHFINYSTSNCSGSCGSAFYMLPISNSTTGTITDLGNEVFQWECTANAQAYLGNTTVAGSGCTTGDNGYSVHTGGATIGAGGNNSSMVSTFTPYDGAFAYSTTFGCAATAGEGGYIVSCPAIPTNARGSNYDAGAYQFLTAAGSIAISNTTVRNGTSLR